MDEMTVRDLIDALHEAAEDTAGGLDAVVRLAQQPRWPFEYDIGPVAAAEEASPAPADGEEPAGVIYIGEGHQLGYLPGGASEALGWDDK